MAGASLAHDTGARIGPNMIGRMLEALRESIGSDATDELLASAGLSHYASAAMPSQMLPEDDVVALFRTARERLGTAAASAAARAAGTKTADYLLAVRIPKFAQMLLRVLPPRLGSPMLLDAISRHTWTFAGSATVRIERGPPSRLAIDGCPECRDASGIATCAYYTATLERLFRALVTARAGVVEVACAATGAPGCVFEIRC